MIDKEDRNDGYSLVSCGLNGKDKFTLGDVIFRFKKVNILH
jgi:hypothetical protein